VYILFNILLPALVFVLVRAEFTSIALAVILLSKWRMFAVRPRFWLANIRTNAVDLIVGLSALALMDGTETNWLRLVYVATWAAWLIVIKPRNDVFWMSVQAQGQMFAPESAALPTQQAIEL
jgi:peptidoglycan/LPS O-acetylase OafA/YrhL